MRGSLTITDDGATAAGGDHGDHGADDVGYQAMTDAMLATMAEFPAETEGSATRYSSRPRCWPTAPRCST